MQTIYTTGQVAKMLKVAPRTVSKWFDSGRLRGYRIPGSQDRRIPREHLISFIKSQGWAMPVELEQFRVFICPPSNGPDGWETELLNHFDDLTGTSSSNIPSTESADWQIHLDPPPECIVVDFSLGKLDIERFAQNLLGSPSVIIAYLSESEMVEDFDRSLFTEIICRATCSVEALHQRIVTLIKRGNT